MSKHSASRICLPRYNLYLVYTHNCEETAADYLHKFADIGTNYNMIKFKILFTLLYLLSVAFGEIYVNQSESEPNNETIKSEVASLKTMVQILISQTERLNELFNTVLEPYVTATSVTLKNIENSISNQISENQQKINTLENKINSINLDLEHKIDGLTKQIENIEEKVTKQGIAQHHSHDILIGEFIGRGILSTLESVEKKSDMILAMNQNSNKSFNDDQCNLDTKHSSFNILHDSIGEMSSKIDAIFDKINATNHIENEVHDYEDVEILTDIGDDSQTNILMKILKRVNQPCITNNHLMQEVFAVTARVETMSRVIHDAEMTNYENLSDKQSIVIDACNRNSKLMQSLPLIYEKFDQQLMEKVKSMFKTHFDDLEKNFASMLNGSVHSPLANNSHECDSCIPTNEPESNHIEIASKLGVIESNDGSDEDIQAQSTITDGLTSIIEKPDKTSCEELRYGDLTGIYLFGNESTKQGSPARNHWRYCEMRKDGIWTVIQRRDNYEHLQNFNLSWSSYKYGFGRLSHDFWLGNELLHHLTTSKNHTLRIELEDFNGEKAWAEYRTFVVLSERENYKLIVGGYSGNASDALSYHNDSMFSTHDRKNDKSSYPDPPCALHYGGGWWFYNCYDGYLNGVYLRKPDINTPNHGIRWYFTLGNYSLKHSLMMIKPRDV